MHPWYSRICNSMRDKALRAATTLERHALPDGSGPCNSTPRATHRVYYTHSGARILTRVPLGAKSSIDECVPASVSDKLCVRCALAIAAFEERLEMRQER
jgi:hypothetical protein